MDYCSERNHGCRIKEYNFRNQRVLDIENELIKVVILLDKGADIYQIIDKQHDLDFLWKKPGGVRDMSKHVVTSQMDFGNFEDYYFGGWQDVFPGGGPTTYKGAQLGLHGEAALMPWDCRVLIDDPEEVMIELSCRTYRMPFTVKKLISLKSMKASIFFDERLTNDSPINIEFIWGQHPVYGDLFIDNDCYIETNARTVVAGGIDVYSESSFAGEERSDWPMMKMLDGQIADLSLLKEAKDKSAELFYMGGFEGADGWYAIKNPIKDINIGIVFDAKVYKHLWMWRIFNGSPDYPLFGRSYHMAMEPFSSYPNNLKQAIKNKTALNIKGNETIETSYVFVIFNGHAEVSAIRKDGSIIYVNEQ